MSVSIYTEQNSSYLKNKPTWHIEDSPWKARQILKMYVKNNLQSKTIIEIGCGAGEILNQLHAHLPADICFTGYEIAPDALKLCEERIKPRIEFKKESLFDIKTKADLLLMIDVFEHVEDCFGFIRASKIKAIHKIYHIPLEINVLSILRNTFMVSRKSSGHLHFYSKETALSVLRDCGLEIIDYFYTPGVETPKKTWKAKLSVVPRKFLFMLNKNFAVKLLGGYSLMVLAK